MAVVLEFDVCNIFDSTRDVDCESVGCLYRPDRFRAEIDPDHGFSRCVRLSRCFLWSSLWNKDMVAVTYSLTSLLVLNNQAMGLVGLCMSSHVLSASRRS